ncbi:hypothetical protein JXQ31_05485 [candidate division KSB1 bacterium]|nr:hypothetical protein [candidate division KSB1 bacterium]
MHKTEIMIINIGLVILIPLMIFVFGWWLSASLFIFKVFPLPESYIIISAGTGLLFGIFIDIFYLKKITRLFYAIKNIYLIPVYLFCSLIAVALFMGLPVANLVLGVTAGLYTGRKYYNLNRRPERFISAAKETSYFTAFVTGVEALPIGLLALQDISIIGNLQSLFQFKLNTANLTIDIILVLLLCSLLFIIQYRLTKFAAEFAYRIKT